MRPKLAYFCAGLKFGSNAAKRGLTFCKAVTFPPTPRTRADLVWSLRVCSDVPTCKGRMSGWHCSAQTALPEGWPSIHASPPGALVGRVAPEGPGLCQKKAEFKDIPPPVRAFDAQNRNAWTVPGGSRPRDCSFPGHPTRSPDSVLTAISLSLRVPPMV